MNETKTVPRLDEIKWSQPNEKGWRYAYPKVLPAVELWHQAKTNTYDIELYASWESLGPLAAQSILHHLSILETPEPQNQ